MTQTNVAIELATNMTGQTKRRFFVVKRNHVDDSRKLVNMSA